MQQIKRKSNTGRWGKHGTGPSYFRRKKRDDQTTAHKYSLITTLKRLEMKKRYDTRFMLTNYYFLVKGVTAGICQEHEYPHMIQICIRQLLIDLLWRVNGFKICFRLRNQFQKRQMCRLREGDMHWSRTGKQILLAFSKQDRHMEFHRTVAHKRDFSQKNICLYYSWTTSIRNQLLKIFQALTKTKVAYLILKWDNIQHI